jgi:hypothetical protein
MFRKLFSSILKPTIYDKETQMMKDYREVWRDLANGDGPTAHDAFVRCLIKAARAKVDGNDVTRTDVAVSLLQGAFSPITNENKLNNGQRPFGTLYAVIHYHYLCVRLGEVISLGGVPLTDMMSGDEFNEFKLIVAGLHVMAKDDTLVDVMKKRYVFTFVRQDISEEQQLVQTAHATGKGGAAFGSGYASAHFVVVGVPDGISLKLARVDVDRHFKTVGFDDVLSSGKSDLTSFTTAPITSGRKRALSGYDKLSFRRTA